MTDVTDMFGHHYTRIIKDPTFEDRLKRVDPNLPLMFDQNDKTSKILENRVGGGVNVIISLLPGEDLDDNILNLLWARRKAYDEKVKPNPSLWFDSFTAEAETVRLKMEEKSSEDHKYRLLDDRNSWRKAARELRNFPSADVTAGYPKITPNPKGAIICEP